MSNLISVFKLKLLAGELARLCETKFWSDSNWAHKADNVEAYGSKTVIRGGESQRHGIRCAIERLTLLSEVVGRWLDTSVLLIMAGKRGGGFGAYYPSGFTVFLTEQEVGASTDRLMCLLARRIAFARAMRGRNFTSPKKLSRAYLIALQFEQKLANLANLDREYLLSIKVRIDKWTNLSCTGKT